MTITLPHAEIPVNEDLSLRQLRPNEAAELFALIDKDRAYLATYLPWAEKTLTVDDSKAFIDSLLEQRQAGTTYGYGIFFKGKLVGHISLMHLADEQDPEIGYWIASDAAGQGIATRAVQAFTKFGFTRLGLPKIIIQASPDNVASNKVAKKAGYNLASQSYDTLTGHQKNTWTCSFVDRR